MEFSRIYRQGALLLSSGILIIAFQNCGKAPGASGSAAGASSGVVVMGATANYSKVTYDPNLEGRTGAAALHLDIDVEAGTVASGGKTCRLDVERDQKLKQLLSVGRVCKPEVPAGMVTCMAMSLADIKLSDVSGADSVLLRSPVCNQGTFLCDGDDEALRSIINDLITNPATNCQ